MLSRPKVPIGFCLILFLVGFGLTAASETGDLATTQLHHRPDNQDSDYGRLETWADPSDHFCVHSTTTLNVSEVGPPERSFEPSVTLRLPFRSTPRTIGFVYYRLRDPPTRLR